MQEDEKMKDDLTTDLPQGEDMPPVESQEPVLEEAASGAPDTDAPVETVPEEAAPDAPVQEETPSVPAEDVVWAQATVDGDGVSDAPAPDDAAPAADEARQEEPPADKPPAGDAPKQPEVPVERVSTAASMENTGPIVDPGRMVGPNRTRSQRHRRGWNLGYFLREGFVSIFRHGLMSFAAVCMTVACLLIMGTFTLVAVNLDANFRELERSNEFSAYLDESLSEGQARALETTLLAVPNVRQVQFVDRLEVLEEFRANRPDDQGLFSLLPDDTFRHRFLIHVDDLEQLQATVDAVERVHGVADTSSFVAGAEGMIAVRNVAAGVALILVVILAVVSLFIIANTLRLAAFYRRDEIAIMRMCGATNGFICWPFVTEGAMLGIFSAGLAFGLQWVVYNMIARSMSTAGQLNFLVVVDFAGLWPGVLIAFCGGGLLIGVLGSLLAIRRFLKV